MGFQVLVSEDLRAAVHRFRGLKGQPDPNGARMAWIQDIMLLDYDDFLKVVTYTAFWPESC